MLEGDPYGHRTRAKSYGSGQTNHRSGPSAEEGQIKDRIRICIGVVPVEEDALWLVQRHGHFSRTDGSRFDQSDEEVREPCDLLRG